MFCFIDEYPIYINDQLCDLHGGMVQQQRMKKTDKDEKVFQVTLKNKGYF